MTMNVYDKFDNATRGICAYALMRDGKHIGRVITKRSAVGMCPMTAFVHLYGLDMTQGRATGCGYDKQSAAVKNALTKTARAGRHADDTFCLVAEVAAWMHENDGHGWCHAFRACGVDVFTVI
jgi:hypothetical protein